MRSILTEHAEQPDASRTEENLRARGIEFKRIKYKQAMAEVKQSKPNNGGINISIDFQSMLQNYIERQGSSFIYEMQQQIQTSDNEWRPDEHFPQSFNIFQPFETKSQLKVQSQNDNCTRVSTSSSSQADLELEQIEIFIHSTRAGTFNYHLRQIFFIISELCLHYEPQKIALVFPKERAYEHRKTADYERELNNQSGHTRNKSYEQSMKEREADLMQRHRDGSDYYGKKILATAIASLQQKAINQGKLNYMGLCLDINNNKSSTLYENPIANQWSIKIFRQLECQLNRSVGFNSSGNELQLFEVTQLNEKVRYVLAPWIGLQHFQQNKCAAQVAQFAHLGYLCFSWNPQMVDWLPQGSYILELNTVPICKYRQQKWQLQTNRLHITALKKHVKEGENNQYSRIIRELFEKNDKIQDESCSSNIYDSFVIFYDSLFNQSTSHDPLMLVGLSQHSLTMLWGMHQRYFIGERARKFIVKPEQNWMDIVSTNKSQILLNYLLASFHPVVDIDNRWKLIYGTHYFEKSHDDWRVRAYYLKDCFTHSDLSQIIKTGVKQNKMKYLIITQQYLEQFICLMKKIEISYYHQGVQCKKFYSPTKKSNSREICTTAPHSGNYNSLMLTQNDFQKNQRSYPKNICRNIFQVNVGVDDESDIDESPIG